MEPPFSAATVTATMATATTAATAAAPNLGYSDSVDSSPRSRNTDSWDEPLPPAPGARLRLMCSYGGHIVPRPHDKNLCYLGGDTRIIVVDRNSSLAELSGRLSRSLLNGRPFVLKYQLPNEDMDSLISVTTDEDLENMIEEYDRTSSSSSKSSRLRLFLFPEKPATASSIGSLLEDPKSETWFVDALNGSGIMPRGFSADSATVNCLLGLEDVIRVDSSADLEGQSESLGSNRQVKHAQDVQSVPDSPMLGTNSSFGSTSSSPSMSNLPPIRVRVEDGGVKLQEQKVGIEEQFSQMSLAASATADVSVQQQQQKQGEGFMVISSQPTLPTTVPSSSVTINSAGVVSENPNRGFSDEERSERGVPVGFQKPANPPQMQQVQQKPSGGSIDLASPSSVSSDNSTQNTIFRQKPATFQDPFVQAASGDSRVSANPVDPKVNLSDPLHRIQMQQVQDSGYVMPPQIEQQQHQQHQQMQQFIHAGTHYIHHPSTGPVPLSSFYQMYPLPPPPQQQHQHQQHHHQQQFDQSYPMYFMHPGHAQPYNFSVQSNMGEAATIASGRPPPSGPANVPPSAVFKDPAVAAASMYSARTANPPKPDSASSVYRTVMAAAPQVGQVPSGQHQQQFVNMGFPQMHHPSQSLAAAPAGAVNYAYEFADPALAQMYYGQPPASTLPPQYQTITPAAAMMLSEVTDSSKQQMRTSQPL